MLESQLPRVNTSRGTLQLTATLQWIVHKRETSSPPEVSSFKTKQDGCCTRPQLSRTTIRLKAVGLMVLLLLIAKSSVKGEDRIEA